MYHNFVKSVKFVFLALLLVGMLAMAPAKTAQAQTCNPACLAINYHITCFSGALPVQDTPMPYYWFNLKSDSTNYSSWMTYSGTSGGVRTHIYNNTAQGLGSWQARVTSAYGPWQFMWSTWQGPRTLTQGSATVFTFWLYKSC